LPLLELREVEARYGEIRALTGVSLSVAEGDVVILLGANGRLARRGYLRSP
jgi:branched-chain amino acid transport system ATP-binding protein